jgi:hypothetical protein
VGILGNFEMCLAFEQLNIVSAGREVHTQAGRGVEENSPSPSADGQPHWIRLNVRDDDSHLALVGNPIYLRGVPRARSSRAAH